MPDLTQVYAQYRSIEPWLKSDTNPPGKERLQSPEERKSWTECGNASCVFVVRQAAPVTGGMATGISARQSCFRLTLDPRPRDEATGERLDELEDPFRLYRCHTIMNCTKTCPKDLNPAAAISEIKQAIAARR